MGKKPEKRLKQFMKEYRKLVKKYGYDFIAKLKVDEGGIKPIIRIKEDKKL